MSEKHLTLGELEAIEAAYDPLPEGGVYEIAHSYRLAMARLHIARDHMRVALAHISVGFTATRELEVALRTLEPFLAKYQELPSRCPNCGRSKESKCE